jgi:hypothetical protein
VRVLTELLEPVEAETPFGGQVVSYEARGAVWLKLGARRGRQRTDAGVSSGVETTTAETRTDPRLVESRVLRFGGGDWAIAGVEPDADRPGRTLLTLEKTR